ncbi:MAG: hypothetical protein ACE5JG_06565 [Planctomycetota bacterium]
MRSRRRSGGFGAALLLGCLAGAAVPAGSEETQHDFEVVDPNQVYYGEGEHPDAPAVCTADQVWAEIPEYQTIIEEGLTEDDPRYHLLMKKASERFRKALEKEAKREGYDLIAEVGAVKSPTGKKIPDATSDLIELVSRD